jgi:CMP-N-acetylneuraminic acid synthetase
VARAIEMARAARSIDRLVVSSDDDHVLEIAAKYD